VDDVEGSAHHAYGLMPNMSWVLDRGGTILYKAEWTSAARIDDFLERRQTQRTGVTTPFHTEQLELRTVDRDALPRPPMQRASRVHRVQARRGDLGRASTQVRIL
jgi:hypothetical protein